MILAVVRIQKASKGPPFTKERSQLAQCRSAWPAPNSDVQQFISASKPASRGLDRPRCFWRQSNRVLQRSACSIRSAAGHIWIGYVEVHTWKRSPDARSKAARGSATVKSEARLAHFHFPTFSRACTSLSLAGVPHVAARRAKYLRRTGGVSQVRIRALDLAE
jgi:hypothetical protein